MSENTLNLENLQISNDLFKNVKCYISGTLDSNVEQLLTTGGATIAKFMVDYITHVICGKNYDETHISEAIDLYGKPSVNEEWVIASAKLGKLAVARPYLPTIGTTSNGLFHRFVFSMSQLDVNDRRNLYGLITFYGGKVQKVFDSKTTHLICGSANGAAYKKALELGRVKVTVITPDWITESVKNKTLLNPETFHPRLLIVQQVKIVKQPTPVIQHKQQIDDSQSLSSIIGLDFEDSIAKSEVPTTSAGTVNVQNVIQSQSTGPSTIASESSPMQNQQGTNIQVQNIQISQSSQQQQTQIQQQTAQNVIIQQQQVTVQGNQIIQTPGGNVRPGSLIPQNVNVTQISQQQFNQIVQNQQGQAQKQGGNMYVFKTQTAPDQASLGQTMGPGGAIIQPDNVNVQNMQIQGQGMAPEGQVLQQQQQQQPPQQQQSPQQQQFMSNQGTIIRTQGPQMQITRPSMGPNQTQQNMGQQFVQPMQQVIHQRPIGMVPGGVPGQPKPGQQILVNQQAYNIQQTRIITSLPSGQQIITSQPLNPQAKIIQQNIIAGQGNINIQKQTLAGPGQQIQHMKPQGGTMIIQQSSPINTSPSQQQMQQMPGNQQQMQGQMGQMQMGPGPAGVSPQQQQQQQQWTPQSPVNQGPQGHQLVANSQVISSPQQGGPQIQVQGAPGQFIRGARPPMQRQLIQLDQATHAQLQKMDPIKQREYLAQLQKQRMMQMRPQGMPQGMLASQGPRPGTQQILIRGQIPPGLNQQQQMQWIQQRQPILVRQTAPGLTPIAGQPGPGQPQQFQIDPNASPQQQQLQLQRQQYQRLQMQRDAAAAAGQKTPGTPVSPRGPGFPDQIDPNQQQQIIIQDPNALPNKTKTALANMLSSRLGNNGAVNAGTLQDVNEPSAAGTLRLMTAQHNANMNQVIQPRTPQEMIAMQQQQQQQAQQAQQQRRTLSNITNAGAAAPPPPNVAQMPQSPIVIPQSPSGIKTGMFSPNRVAIQRPQYFGHNPNLKLPVELFLLGCIFHIVEYDETNAKDLPDWKELIKKYGGAVEECYSGRVTHVLCRTQRHGVVMQAIRDSKRCVTAFWLSDVIGKKVFQPPWQALHLPTPATFGVQKPCTKQIMSITGFEGEERDRIKQMVIESGAKLTSYFSRHNSVLICKRINTENKKYKKAKEWGTPMVNAIWLSDILLGNLSQMSQHDNAKYQQYNLQSPFRIDFSLVAHLMNPWKQAISLTQESAERLKRNATEPPPHLNKKQRTLPPLEIIPDEITCTKQPDQDKVPKVMFSNVDNVDGLTRAVTTLGGQVVSDCSEATVLVMTRVKRSSKLMYGLCVCQFIVSSKWLIESAKVGYFLPLENFALTDTDFEAEYKCDIQKVLHSPLRKTLFEGKTFYVTPKVIPDIKDLTKWIELCGGKVEKTRRSNARIQDANLQTPGSYMIITCETDLHLVLALTKPGKSYCSVCSSEYVMQSIMRQVLNLEPHLIRASK